MIDLISLLSAQEPQPAPPAQLLRVWLGHTLRGVADHLLGPALPVQLGATAAHQARYVDIASTFTMI